MTYIFQIGYYQWVPLLLLLMALIFYIPCMVWRFMNNKAGIDVNNIVEAGMTLQHTAYAESHKKTLRYMTKNLDRYLGSTREYRRGCWVNCKHFMSRNCCLFCGRRYGNYIVALYMIVKLLYLGNTVLQMYLLDIFLGSEYHMYGFRAAKSIVMGQNITSSDRFPKVTLCDFEIRELGNVHKHTVQCVLPINMFNEKIFLFIWFWYAFLALGTFGSMVSWLAKTMFGLNQMSFIRNHLRSSDSVNKNEDIKLQNHFVQKYLRQDGVLILRLVGINANDIVVDELISELWSQYKMGRPNGTRLVHRTNSVEV